jgi:protein-L-isoaspartate(D-aspartate) O-methyltransferase
MNDAFLAALRRQMVHEITLHAEHAEVPFGRHTLSDQVLEAMGKVPRHEFVPVELRTFAYADRPLPIGYDKTISQPFIVALMTDLLDVDVDDTVLEVGTGLGYQAAVLAELVDQVYSIEELGSDAKKRLARLGYDNVHTRVGDGCLGWAEAAPFDAIIVTAAPDLIPSALLGQLKPGGRMVIPAGASLESQQLTLVEKDSDGRVRSTELLPVRFSELESAAEIYRA